MTPRLEAVKPKVQEAVNREIQHRIATKYPGGKKLRYQCPRPWAPNAAFVNCYNGPQQNVGWHSDQLTYLGPRAVIGSLSLGVAREFRVRRVLPRTEMHPAGDSSGAKTTQNAVADEDSLRGDAEGQISIHLPHNSLLVMHAEMQEEWKHSIAPAQAIEPHPIAGNRRINVTYRDYRPEYHPSLTPKCRCGIATVMRVVQKKKENWGKNSLFFIRAAPATSTSATMLVGTILMTTNNGWSLCRQVLLDVPRWKCSWQRWLFFLPMG